MSNVAVSINTVKKTFLLPHSNYDSIKQKVLDIFKKKQKGYKKYEALKGIDLEIKKGEFIGILGRNGAGKSTLLKMIAQIYQPSSGSVKVNGKLVPFIELGVGFKKNLSGRDNVYLNGAMLGFSRSEIDEMYDSIVDFAELHEFMDQKLKNYSSGMKVRLAFSVAIKANADILLLDEVLAVGDAAFKRKCYDYFDTLKRDKKTIIFVTHNMSAARNYCDRAVLIDDGVIAFEGSPEEAATKYFQMFNTTKKFDRTGKEISLDSVTVETGESSIGFKVKITNQTDDPINDVLIKVALKKQNGRVVAGFDNKNIEEPFAVDLRANESKTLYFESANIFGNGNYVVNASLQSNNTIAEHPDDEEGEDEINSVVYDSQPGVAVFFIDNALASTPVVLPVIATSPKNKD